MNPDPANTEDHLIRDARKGNHTAYNQLMERYQPKILQTINCSVNDQVLAKDLSQDVMLKVYKYLPDFKGDCKFSTWLYRITQNTIKNYYRTLNQRSALELHSVDELHSSFYSSPEKQLINLELGGQVERALLKLSKELRLCYGMYLLEGKSYESIAEALQCPIGTVRSRIHRARKMMTEFVNNKTC